MYEQRFHSNNIPATPIFSQKKNPKLICRQQKDFHRSLKLCKRLSQCKRERDDKKK